MTRTIFIATALALAVTLPAVQAQAQAPRTFVSAAGSDSNPCSFAAPCRHFQAAVNATSAGGEVDALDPAGYGPIIISQAITIEGQGWSYIAPPAGGNAITINAVSGKVTLRGLSLNGAGITGSTNGIIFNSGPSLTIEGCIVSDMLNDGLDFISSATTQRLLAVSNSHFTNNQNNGILVQSESSGTMRVAIDRTVFSGNDTGLMVDGSNGTNDSELAVAVTDSVAANNGSFGISLKSAGPPHSHSDLALTHSLVTGSSVVGIQVYGTSAQFWLAQSTVAGNSGSYLVGNGGIMWSYGDNYLAAANGGDTGGTLTAVNKQ